MGFKLITGELGEALLGLLAGAGAVTLMLAVLQYVSGI